MYQIVLNYIYEGWGSLPETSTLVHSSQYVNITLRYFKDNRWPWLNTLIDGNVLLLLR